MGLLLLVVVVPIVLGIMVIIGIVMLVGTGVNSMVDGAIDYASDKSDERAERYSRPSRYTDARQININTGRRDTRWRPTGYKHCTDEDIQAMSNREYTDYLNAVDEDGLAAIYAEYDDYDDDDWD